MLYRRISEALLALTIIVVSSAMAARRTPSVAENMNSFKIRLQHTLEGARIRRKRQEGILTSISDAGTSSAEHLRVASSAPEVLPYLSDYNVTHWTNLRHEGKNQILVGTRSGDLILLQLGNGKPQEVETVAVSIGEQVGHKAQAFSHFHDQWFVVLKNFSSKTWLQLYLRIGRGLERRQIIGLEQDSDFKLITVRGIQYLVVISYKVPFENGFTYRSELRLYQWFGTQFDVVATRVVYGARSLALWTMDGALYISVAQETDNAGNINIGSPVFMFNVLEGKTLVLVDLMRTRGPYKMAHFYVSGSHYLLFVGPFEAEIYWWSSGQFLLWQTLSNTANAADVSVLELDHGEVILVIALKEEVQFLTLDATGHYILSFTLNFFDATIHSMQFMHDRWNFYLLLTFAESGKTNPHPIWKMTLDRYDLPILEDVDPLLQCLGSLKDEIVSRRAELSAIQLDLERVWVTNKEQIITAPVIVHGTISFEEEAIVDRIVISSNETDVVPVSTLEREIAEVDELEVVLGYEMDNVVLKSTYQEIYGAKFFMGTVSLPSLSLPHVDLDVTVNGISISRLAEKTLKKSGDQTITGHIALPRLSAGSATIGLLNNINLDDVMLLHGEQRVSGVLNFTHLSANNVSTKILNSVPVQNVVTRHTVQAIDELKMFKTLEVDSLHVVGQTNGEYFGEIVNRTMTLHGDQEHHGGVVFRSTLHVENMTLLGKINHDIDVAALDMYAMKRNIPQTIAGIKKFKSGIEVQGKVTINGHLNGIKLEDILTLNSDQTVTGNIFFNNTVTVDHAMTGTVNGHRLLEDAVWKTNAQDVQLGHKIFLTDVIVKGDVDVAEGVKIDGVDISEEFKNMVTHDKGVVRDSVTFGNVTVLQNLTALEGINGFKVYDLPDTVWMRNRTQKIKVPLDVHGQLVIENDLEVGTVNQLNLDDDFVHTFQDEVIRGRITFLNTVKVTRKIVTNGSFVNGFNFNSFRELNYENLQDNVIYGKKILPSLEVTGSISTDYLNNVAIPDSFMHPNKSQIVYGDYQFVGPIIPIAGNVSIGDLDVNYFSDVPLKKFFHSAVTRSNSNGSYISNKNFAHLKAKEMLLSDGSTIDNVRMPDLLYRTVLLSTDQFISAPKNFLGDLHFADHVVASTVNQLDLISLAKNVVLTTEAATVTGRKTFLGNVTVNDMKTLKLLNNINVTQLNSNVFWKTEINDMEAHMVFMNDVEMGSLYVDESALVDGISLDDTVSTEEDAVLGKDMVFEVPFEAKSDIYVAGKVNGCDLGRINSYGLRSKGTVQHATGNFKFGSLNVTGDVVVEKLMNNVSLELMVQSIVEDDSYQVISGNFYIYPGLSATNIRIIGTLNGSDISKLFRDAMTKSGDQVVTGYKTFLTDLDVDILTGREVNTLTVNDVDVKSLYESTVRKTGFQVINGEKSFLRLEAENVTVYETINGVRLPEDVVRTGGDETIRSPVIMKNATFMSDLIVHGNVDGINLTQLMEDRVTLDGDEAISSDLVFWESVFIDGELTVDGTVNDVVLELVATTQKLTILDGFKSFAETVSIAGHVTASTVNGLDIREMSQNIASVEKNEIFPMPLVFTQPLHAMQLLNATLINGVSLPALVDLFAEKTRHWNIALEFFSEMADDHDKQLVQQAQMASYGVSSFAYFVLSQELDLKSTRILHGYPELSHGLLSSYSMVAWTTQSTCPVSGKCCHDQLSYWLKVDKDAEVTVGNKPDSGLYFPVTNVHPTLLSHKMAVFSNSTINQPKWCHVGVGKSVIGTFNEAGHFETFLEVLESATLRDIRTFKDDYLYLVAGYHYDHNNEEYSATVVYRGHEGQSNWKVHQILPVYGILSMDLTTVFREDEKRHLLALGSGMKTYPKSSSSVYEWNSAEKQFVLLENIPSQYVTSSLWVHHRQRVLLLLSSVDHWFESGMECSESKSGGQINVYSYGTRLTWIQSIPLQGVMSMVYFTMKGETYLAAASQQMQTVDVLQWRGYQEFVVVHSFFVKDAQHLNTFVNNDNLYMIVASGLGPTKVFRAFVRGSDQSRISSRLNMTYLDDQPHHDKHISTC